MGTMLKSSRCKLLRGTSLLLAHGHWQSNFEQACKESWAQVGSVKVCKHVQSMPGAECAKHGWCCIVMQIATWQAVHSGNNCCSMHTPRLDRSMISPTRQCQTRCRCDLSQNQLRHNMHHNTHDATGYMNCTLQHCKSSMLPCLSTSSADMAPGLRQPVGGTRNMESMVSQSLAANRISGNQGA